MQHFGFQLLVYLPEQDTDKTTLQKRTNREHSSSTVRGVEHVEEHKLKTGFHYCKHKILKAAVEQTKQNLVHMKPGYIKGCFMHL